jgi:hypothetical protein
MSFVMMELLTGNLFVARPRNRRHPRHRGQICANSSMPMPTASSPHLKLGYHHVESAWLSDRFPLARWTPRVSMEGMIVAPCFTAPEQAPADPDSRAVIRPGVICTS